MAVLTIYNPLVFAGGVGDVTVATDTQITIVAGTVTQNYYGSGFTYAPPNLVTGGVVTATDFYDSSNGGLQYTFTGLNHAAPTVASYVNSGDQDGLRAFLLNGNDTLIGSSGSDILNGFGGVNVVYGNGGADSLYGGSGVDSLVGGAGDDAFYIWGSNPVSITENPTEGADTVYSFFNFLLPANVENLVLDGIAVNGGGNDANNVLQGNTQANLLTGLGGSDRLLGNEGNDTLEGGASADTLTGGLDNDWLDGGGGADVMQGGDGNDTYVIDDSGDSITEAALEGIDSVRSSRTYTLLNEFENLTLLGSDSISGFGNVLSNVISGNDSNNTLGGSSGNDTLVGFGGVDTVFGGNDDDWLDGGTGADIMQGGAGSDTYVVENAGDSISEAALGGNDLVISAVNYVLPNEVERLTLTGMASSGTGNSSGNFITGNSAANTLDGGAGIDTLSGGLGDDIYYLDVSEDQVVDSGGVDGVVVSFSFDLNNLADIENVSLAGLLNINATGNALTNVISGNAGRNVLSASGAFDRLIGGGGDDTLIGTAFVDTLDGGTGADSMSGGAGGDFFYIDDVGDVIVDASVPLAGDTVLSSISYTAPSGIGAVVLLGSASINATGSYSLTGNAGNNVLTGVDATSDTLSGFDGNDTLVGGFGGDVLQGGTGDDTYLVNGSGLTLLEGDGAGRDTIRSVVSEFTRANVEVLVLLGSGNISGGGNELDNIISGNSGNNELFGAVGADIIAGGAGDDTYFVDNAGDIVMELVNSGIDAVHSDVSYDLMMAWHVERLMLTGMAAVSGYGNWLDNWITGNSAGNVIRGNAGNDTLDGAGGNDTLFGGSGNDLYLFSSATDVAVEMAGEGVDTIASASSYDLMSAAQVEVLDLAGGISGDGNGLNNLIRGNADGNALSGRGGNDTLLGDFGSDNLNGDDGDDLLEGGAGTDTLSGGAGLDTLIGGTNNDLYLIGDPWDIVVEAVDGGSDSIMGAQSLSLSDVSNVEVALLDGTADVNATGSGGNDFLVGNSGSNTLTGLDGADHLNGRAGVDVLLGGSGADTLVGGDGVDSVFGGNGNDFIIWDPADGAVRGEAGFDVLVLSFGGPQLNLELIDNALIQDVEAIDMGAFSSSPGDVLRFSVSDILALSSTSDVLRIDGDSADAVVAAVPDWVAGSTVVIGDQTYAVYTNGTATIQVDIDINRSGLVPGLPEIDLAGLDGSDGFVLQGTSVFDQTGAAAAALGDINGDGFDDVIIGARYADPAGSNSGAAYVVFGAAGGWSPSLQLESLNGSNGWILNGAAVADQFGVSAGAAGDVNGDGYGDFFVGAFWADIPDNLAGSGYLVFGGSSAYLDGLHGTDGFDVAGVNGTNGVALHGAAALALAGRSMSGAGDVNGDGFDDLLIGAYGDAPNGSYSGASYVVFGGSPAYLDALHGLSGLSLFAIDGANGLRLNGANSNDLAGIVSMAGDVNADGYDDVLVGARGTDFNGSSSGSTYLVFGGNNAYVDAMHGSSGFNLSGLDGTNGFRISGRNALDFSGSSVSSAGDFNGDGYADLLIGAPPAPNNQRFGESYVVFGAAGGFAASIDLSSLNGANGFRIDGAQAGDGAGISVSSAGDFNGDGFDDLIIGAYQADPSGSGSGSAYVLFGSADGFGAVINLGTPGGVDALKLDGLAAGDVTGRSVGGGGDINGDGYDDIIVGAPYADPGGLSSAGSTYVIFGSDVSGSVDFLGGGGADSLSGTAGADSFVAGAGNDTVTGGGGADVVRTGAGNDRIRIADTAFADIDGGSGQDVLVLDGSGLHLNLTTLSNTRLSGIEVVDLTGSGSNTLTLSASDLLDLSSQGNVITVDGNSGDTVNLQGAWINAGGAGYTTYHQGQATILVDTDIAVTFI